MQIPMMAGPQPTYMPMGGPPMQMQMGMSPPMQMGQPMGGPMPPPAYPGTPPNQHMMQPMQPMQPMMPAAMMNPGSVPANPQGLTVTYVFVPLHLFPLYSTSFVEHNLPIIGKLIIPSLNLKKNSD